MKLATLRNKLIKYAEYTNFSIEINRAEPSNFDFNLDNDKIYSELKYLLDQYAFFVNIYFDANFIKIIGKTRDFPKLEKEIKNIFPNANIISNYVYIQFYITKEINILKLLSKIKDLVNNIHISEPYFQYNYNSFTIIINIPDDNFSVLSDLIEEETGKRPALSSLNNKLYIVDMLEKNNEEK